MKNLHETLIILIEQYTLLIDCNNLRKINKIFNNTLLNTCKKNYKLKQKFITNNFNPIIVDLMGGIHNMILFPILEWKPTFLGIDYIDNIRPDDVNYTIMMGIDSFKRPFITIKTITKYNSYVNPISVCTIFQRFTNDKSTWTHGTYSHNDLICETGYFLNRNNLNHKLIKSNIKNLLENKGFIFQYNLKNDDLIEIPLHL